MKSPKQIPLTPESSLDEGFIKLCKSVNDKRPRRVIDHILKHGIITTEELSELYDYKHPPRAARDVRENGIPLVTYMIVSDKSKRNIAAYTFGNPEHILRGRIGGRKAFSKQFKQKLIEAYGSRDAFTTEPLHERYLQIDHRTPYEVAGDGDSTDAKDYMLIDASSQRAKSWSCEHCKNFLEIHDLELCKSCFWAYPESYTHICLTEKRRIDLVWSGSEIEEFDDLKMTCSKKGIRIQDYIKMLLRK